MLEILKEVRTIEIYVEHKIIRDKIAISQDGCTNESNHEEVGVSIKDINGEVLRQEEDSYFGVGIEVNIELPIEETIGIEQTVEENTEIQNEGRVEVEDEEGYDEEEEDDDLIECEWMSCDDDELQEAKEAVKQFKNKKKRGLMEKVQSFEKVNQEDADQR
ncbi:hypothetical protein JCGZ_03236 [Jatropha curcas]|uniref:Uncharacterized protein n=1 Tax=Jatropha curcas TaxID=180498 RepID=A0A067KY16_JATCU|nr:hypothetical protein JCGZ_03236 [Jatropha curcas]